MEYEISNIVATANLGTEIKLEVAMEFLRTVGKVTYVRRKFPGLVVKLRNRMSVLLFRTGKMVIAGGRSIDDVKRAVKDVLRALRPALSDLPNALEVQIQNIVARADLGAEINLERLSGEMPGARYDPDQFPGLIYNPGFDKPTTLVFRTGKVVIVGAKSEEEIADIVKELKKYI